MALEIMFLIGFLLHNLEEYILLPKWSEESGVFHPRVTRTQFGVLVPAVSVLGILITYLFVSQSSIAVNYLYYAFVMTMDLNVIFPHVFATVWQRRYAPGLLTALLLNLPLGIILLNRGLYSGIDIASLILTTLGVVGLFILFFVVVLNFRKP